MEWKNYDFQEDKRGIYCFGKLLNHQLMQGFIYTDFRSYMICLTKEANGFTIEFDELQRR